MDSEQTSMRSSVTVLSLVLALLLILNACGLNANTALTVSPQFTETSLPSNVISPTASPTVNASPTSVPSATPEPSPSPTPSATPNLFSPEELEDIAWEFFAQNHEQVTVLETHEVPEGTRIKTLRETPLFMIPLRPDFLMETIWDVQLVPVPLGFDFQLEKIKVFSLPNGIELSLGLLANSYNTHQTWVLAMPLSVHAPDGSQLDFADLEQSDNAVVTFTATRDDIYPNKVENILLALKQISAIQENSGAFLQGHDYSYLGLVGLANGEFFNLYKDGLNKFKSPIRANGICAIATGLSTLLIADGYPNYLFQEKHAHRDLYHQGPFSFPRFLVDSAIEFGPEQYQKFDLKWKQPKTAYLKLNLHIFRTGLDFDETWENGVDGPSDMGMLVSLSFSEEAPKDQLAMLKTLSEEVLQFRETKHESGLKADEIQKTVRYYPLTDIHTEKLARMIYDVENIEAFAEIIAADPTLQDIMDFAKTVNSYVEDQGQFLNAYIKDSDWYARYQGAPENPEANISRVIDKGANRQIKGEPLQCIGFVMILTDLYPSLALPDISSAPVEFAGQLIPSYVYGTEGTNSVGYGGERILVGKSLTIDSYKAGDVFVFDGLPGHVGLILAKTDGKLLAADSNRLWDGKVRFFVVDENNFDDVFGIEKFIVLGHGQSE